MPLLVVPFQLMNQGHTQKELEEYLDFRWLTTPLRWHDPKGYIVAHFQKLGLTTSYRHEPYPDDSFFEDFNSFENVLECIVTRNLPAYILAILGQDLELERLEWRKQCFLKDPNKKKKLEVARDNTKIDGLS